MSSQGLNEFFLTLCVPGIGGKTDTLPKKLSPFYYLRRIAVYVASVESNITGKCDCKPMTPGLLTSIILLLAVGGGERTDPPFPLLRLSIAHMEMKSMGENPKGVGVGKRENKCTLWIFFF